MNKFHQKLFFIVQVLHKMNELRDIKVYEMLTLDKLRKVMGYFVKLDDEWQEIDFLKLAASLCNWTDRNLKTLNNSEKQEKNLRENIFQIKGRECKNRESNPKASVCKIVRNQGIKPVSVSQPIERRSVG